MTMIYEDYCSKELCMLLKEKEINTQFKHAYYNPDEDGCRQHYCKYSHAVAMKWLREVHNILIIPRWVYNNGNTEVVYGYTIFKVFPLPYKDYSNENIWYVDYREAVEAAIKYSLENLI